MKIRASPASWDLSEYDPAGLQIRYGVPENTDTPHSIIIFNYSNVTLTPKYYEEYYDASGRFVGSCSENTNLSSLAPGGSVEIPLQGGSCVVLEVGRRTSSAGGPLTIRFSVGLAFARTAP